MTIARAIDRLLPSQVALELVRVEIDHHLLQRLVQEVKVGLL